MKSISKLDWTTIPLTDQVFSWNDPDTGETLHFAVTRMQEVECRKLTIVSVPVDKEFPDWAIKMRGVEEHRLRTCKMHLRADSIPPPVLFAAMPDGTHLLLDGVHRYVALAQEGWSDCPAYIVPEEVWRRYLIDLPNETNQQILGTFSGIL